MLVDLKPYMDDDTIGWKDAEPIREVLLDGAKIDGKQYGIPLINRQKCYSIMLIC